MGGERPPSMEDLLFSGVRLPGLRQEEAAWLRGAAGPSSTRRAQNRLCSETPPLSGERDPLSQVPRKWRFVSREWLSGCERGRAGQGEKLNAV